MFGPFLVIPAKDTCVSGISEVLDSRAGYLR